ncbi:Ergosterol biosynthesis ERG4/ERG24 family isoform 2 [Hibiscus syriacus]|uniref:7-dehydrocholesterol reductase n=1 Tax=Hibiscus syriacus TaxID=106335 RepID=A0A6A2Y8R4_HIBSY|nr:Ergosterol biosynthesis ERG4/ERG24 family isoform 2 [Hibiscus syriacus]
MQLEKECSDLCKYNGTFGFDYLSIVVGIWHTMVHADGSVVQTWNFLKQQGLQGFIEIWPRPTTVVWKIIFVYGAFEAALQFILPGKRVEGPSLPLGTDLFTRRMGHVAPSSTDSGSSGNLIIDFYWGMELYPRIGKSFDTKVFTNCRFGMMSWAVLAVTYCIKQVGVAGHYCSAGCANKFSLRSHIARPLRSQWSSFGFDTCEYNMMFVYVTKYFWWEAGYWNTMDIAHDRGVEDSWAALLCLQMEGKRLNEVIG